MPTKVMPLARIWRYDRGADPYFGAGSDFGWDWYDILANTGWRGVSSVDEQGLSDLELLDADGNIGRLRALVCRAKVAFTHTHLTDWSVSGGVWEERAAPGDLAVVGLVQADAGADVVWSATSEDEHPSEPSFAFSFLLGSVPVDHNRTQFPPFAEFSWSDGAWAIRFFPNRAPVLLQRTTAGLTPMRDLREPTRRSFDGRRGAALVVVRVQRGAICVSTDGGELWTAYQPPDGSAVAAPAGKYSFRGQGAAAAFGLHQVVYDAGTYTSARKPTLRTRTVAPALSFRGVSGPFGATVVIEDAAGSDKDYAQYRATLTPAFRTTSQFDYYYSPEVYAVELSYPTSPTAGSDTHDGGAAFEGRLLNVTVNKPAELDQATATWTARYSVAAGGFSGVWALRKVRIWLGHEYDNGTNDLAVAFTGYITDVEAIQRDSSQVTVRFTAQGGTLRPKRMQWTDFVRPLGGLTVNAALQRWLTGMGLSAAWGSFDARGDAIILPAGSPEEPAYVPRPGRNRWELPAEFCRHARLELAWNDVGQFTTVPADAFVDNGRSWLASPVDPDDRLESVEFGQRVLDSHTGVIARGRTSAREQVFAFMFDPTAEMDPTSDRFRPWREWHNETIPGETTRAWCNIAAQGLYFEKVLPRFEARWEGELFVPVSRREQVRLVGASTGLADTDELGVLAIRHEVDRQTGTAKTTLSGVRLP